MLKSKNTAPEGYTTFSEAVTKYGASKPTMKSWSSKDELPTLQPDGQGGIKYIEIASLERLLKERDVASIYKETSATSSKPSDNGSSPEPATTLDSDSQNRAEVEASVQTDEKALSTENNQSSCSTDDLQKVLHNGTEEDHKKLMAMLEQLMTERNSASKPLEEDAPNSKENGDEPYTPITHSPEMGERVQVTQSRNKSEPCEIVNDKTEVDVTSPTTNESDKAAKSSKRKRNKHLSDEQIDRIIMQRTRRQLLLLRDKLTDELTKEALHDK